CRCAGGVVDAGGGAAIGGRANSGGIVAAAAGSEGALGFSKRNSWNASPAQKLVRYCVRMVSQMRRASSGRFLAFKRYTCESSASGALKLFVYSDALCWYIDT